MKPNDEPASTEEVLPTWDVALPPPPPESPAEALPVAEAVPVAETDPNMPVAEPVEPAQPEPTAAPPRGADATPLAAAPVLCPVCGAERRDNDSSCRDCGYYFSLADLAGGTEATSRGTAGNSPEVPVARLKNRFECREWISERRGVTRYRGLDHGDGSGEAVRIIIVRQPVPAVAMPAEEEKPRSSDDTDDFLPAFDDEMSVAAVEATPSWPSLDWEQALLSSLAHPGLPAVIDRFSEDGFDYLIEEVPAGRSLWDAWDDAQDDAAKRFGYLVDIADILHHLHQANSIIEGLRPELIVVAPDGQARLADLSDLLPLPLPADPPLKRTLYTAPELLAGKADARADLFSFGAMLYALHVGRDLNEVDFDRSGKPKPFLPRFPDIHPAFGRLMIKTFRTEVEGRFPSDEAAKEDATGFTELIRTLRTLGRTLDNVRLEIASWTTTGMMRTGNEDAFALLHACESRQDDLGESALLLLCDGMGGYEAGEIAAALAIQVMRRFLIQQKLFAPLAGASAFPGDVLSNAPRSEEGNAAGPIDVEAVKAALKAALKEANKQVFTASRAPGSKRRGMGCTAEAVYVDGRNVVVGHVGDSRTYHLHQGRLIQLTRDQTLVNRLVELGTLTPEEAETHPRRNELQQAIGGQPDVEPGLYHGTMEPGDWVVVCSDGLSNHVSNEDLQQMLQGEGYSAETVARRLVNLVNLQGATDNATVVVVRAT